MHSRLHLPHIALALTLLTVATTGRAPRLVIAGPRDLPSREALLQATAAD
jgi:hypothetical protein